MPRKPSNVGSRFPDAEQGDAGNAPAFGCSTRSTEPPISERRGGHPQLRWPRESNIGRTGRYGRGVGPNGVPHGTRAPSIVVGRPVSRHGAPDPKDAVIAPQRTGVTAPDREWGGFNRLPTHPRKHSCWALTSRRVFVPPP
jgi:hypothetical protein